MKVATRAYPRLFSPICVLQHPAPPSHPNVATSSSLSIFNGQPYSTCNVSLLLPTHIIVMDHFSSSSSIYFFYSVNVSEACLCTSEYICMCLLSNNAFTTFTQARHFSFFKRSRIQRLSALLISLLKVFRLNFEGIFV